MVGELIFVVFLIYLLCLWMSSPKRPSEPNPPVWAWVPAEKKKKKKKKTNYDKKYRELLSFRRYNKLLNKEDETP